jgi:RecA-family ATPase
MDSTNKPQWQPKFLDSAAFAVKKYARSWLAEPVFVRGQPAVVGGPKKTLKTSLAIDLVISLGSGTPFLGHFPVPKQLRVASFSGESGDATVQETAQRVCAGRGVSLAKDCDVLWSFELPRLNSLQSRTGLRAFLTEHRVKVVLIDPLYLCLLSGGKGASASNLYETGPLLHGVAKACLGAGATPIFVHHFTKSASKKSEGADLDDLSFSGVAEFARQWVLLSRRRPYKPGTGQHELLMSAGGSAGHSAEWQIDVDEGVLNSDFTGRTWQVTVRRTTPSTVVTKRNKGWS